MIIKGRDCVTQQIIELSADLITDHPDSHGGEPVMYVAAWDSCMSVDYWMRGCFVVVEETEKEAKLFRQWFNLVEAIYS